MTRTRRYVKTQAKAISRRRLNAQERHERQQKQAQRDIEALRQALDDLAGYVTPEQVVLCEGGRLQGGKDFDAECYNEIFQGEYPHVVFLELKHRLRVVNEDVGIED